MKLMRTMVLIIVSFICILFLGGCSKVQIPGFQTETQIEKELKTSGKIVFVNNKEKTLRITVSDSKVIGQIASIIGKGKSVDGSSGVPSDYTVIFYLPGGKQVVFDYWMGAFENSKDVNLRDENGVYYIIPESMDTYIVNSTKMTDRPKNFVDLYAGAVSKCISLLEKDKQGKTTVGVDITSDRKMRKYTMSYEEEKLMNAISAEGYSVVPYTKDDKYTYVVTFVTNIYAPSKAQIVVEAMRSEDSTKTTFTVDALLQNDKAWTYDVKR